MIVINGFVIRIWWVCGGLLVLYFLWICIFFEALAARATEEPKE